MVNFEGSFLSAFGAAIPLNAFKKGDIGRREMASVSCLSGAAAGIRGAADLAILARVTTDFLDMLSLGFLRVLKRPSTSVCLALFRIA